MIWTYYFFIVVHYSFYYVYQQFYLSNVYNSFLMHINYLYELKLQIG